jgi:hypothetical protein
MLSIPTLPDGVDTLTAALAYVADDWYVLPTDPAVDIKHPGSVVGNHWQDKSSRDPKQIAAWFAGTNYGIALHCGRSGAVVLDVDNPDKLDTLRPHLNTAPYQPTRPNTPDRGHYVFAMPPGRAIGNGAGRLPKGWGEVRGLNGVIIATPTPHPEGGHYGPWQRTGAVPVLPDEVASQLDNATPACDAASDVEIAAFAARHTAASRPGLLDGWKKALGNHFAMHSSRHQSTVTVLVGALKEARAGYLSAQVAVDAIGPLFVAEVGKPPGSKHQNAARNGTVAASEFRGILAWAVGQANAADLDEVRARVDAQMPDNNAWMYNVNGQVRNTHADFWSATETLGRVRDWARSRRTSPWATLGPAMARVVATIPPTTRIYPYVGPVGSLNLFAGLVGPSGFGKGGAEGVAAAALRTAPVYATGPGSGEGINHLFAHYDKEDAKKGGTGTKFHRHQVYLSVREVDTLTNLGSRSGSTLLAQLCKAWSGEDLTFAYADATKALIIPEHSYRLCMVVGIQPGRADALLDATDTGVPQRFLWLPTDDPDIPDLRPSAPDQIDCIAVAASAQGSSVREIELPPAAAYLIDRNEVLKKRGHSADAALDGHLGLCRIKVAIALALLHGYDQYQLTQEHWDLAGVVMAVSKQTRDRVVAYRNAQGIEAERQRGKREGVRTIAAEAVKTDEAIKRVAKGVVRYLRSHGASTHGAIRKKALASWDRGYLDAAVERLIAAGQVEVVSSGAGDLLRLVTP